MAPADWPTRISFGEMLQKWLYARGLDKKLRCDAFSLPSEDYIRSLPQLRTASPIIYYTYTGSVVQAGEHWDEAYHGTWWYGLWSILESGVLLESNDDEAGHEFWHPGVFCSRHRETAWTYARPQQVFHDGLYHRVMLKLRYDRNQLRKERKKGGHQLVLQSSAVVIEGVFFGINAPPSKGEERLDDWDASLEASPPSGQCRKRSFDLLSPLARGEPHTTHQHHLAHPRPPRWIIILFLSCPTTHPSPNQPPSMEEECVLKFPQTSTGSSSYVRIDGRRRSLIRGSVAQDPLIDHAGFPKFAPCNTVVPASLRNTRPVTPPRKTGIHYPIVG